jgi:DNA-directed RNA polymerase specialized sigma24 family protein
LERWEIVEWLTEGLEQLRPRCRDLLMALYFEPGSPSYEQIAERLSIPVGSIGPTRARCLTALRQALREAASSPPLPER